MKKEAKTFFHWRVETYDTLASTSDLCRARAADGEAEGLAVIARSQLGGRGSYGRGWDSPEGNLYISVLLRPDGTPRDGGLWSLLAALALAEAVETFLPAPSSLRLKWPNDLLLNGKKLAGILLDSTADAGGRITSLVIGIGLNIAHAPQIPGRATACLADAGPPPTPAQAATALLARLDHWREIATSNFAPIREACLRLMQPIGSPIAFRQGTHDMIGTFAGLGERGALRLHAGGALHEFAAGEVRLLKGETLC